MYTDQELIQSIKVGESYLLDIFYKKNYLIISHYIKQNRGNEEDAQDVFQEAITVLIRKVIDSNFEQTAALSTYLFAISKNIWLNHLRDNKMINIDSFDVNSHDIKESTDEDNIYNPVNKISKWLALITKHCQQILKAIFYYNQPIETLMIKMGWKNRHTASNQKYKCIQQLKKIKEKDESLD